MHFTVHINCVLISFKKTPIWWYMYGYNVYKKLTLLVSRNNQVVGLFVGVDIESPVRSTQKDPRR